MKHWPTSPWQATPWIATQTGISRDYNVLLLKSTGANDPPGVRGVVSKDKTGTRATGCGKIDDEGAQLNLPCRQSGKVIGD